MLGQGRQVTSASAGEVPDRPRFHFIIGCDAPGGTDGFGDAGECSDTIPLTVAGMELMLGMLLWRRFRVYYTPKHGSWLNPAEIEISMLSRECLGRDRIPELCDLKTRIQAWVRRANRMKRKINLRLFIDSDRDSVILAGGILRSWARHQNWVTKQIHGV
jgi:hypothetical protein